MDLKFINTFRPFIIAIEGVDCAFKETNTKALYDHFINKGKKVYVLHFPRHNEKSCYFIDNFLNGKYRFDYNDPAICRMMAQIFSMDRYDTYMQYNDYFTRPDADTVIILDRYVKSNMYNIARMYSHIQDTERFLNCCFNEAEDMFSFDYDILKLPHEDCTLYLTPTYEMSKKVRAEKATTCGIDVNEADEDLQYKAWLLHTQYIQRCRYAHGPCDNLIWTSNNEEFRSKEEIAADVINSAEKAYKYFRGEINV